MIFDHILYNSNITEQKIFYFEEDETEVFDLQILN